MDDLANSALFPRQLDSPPSAHSDGSVNTTGTSNDDQSSTSRSAAASENELLVLDEFLSFVDEFDGGNDVNIGNATTLALAPSLPCSVRGHGIHGLAPAWSHNPEPIALDTLSHHGAPPHLFGQYEAQEIYHAAMAPPHVPHAEPLHFFALDDSIRSTSGTASSESGDTLASMSFPLGASPTPGPGVGAGVDKTKKKRRRRQKEELDYLRGRVHEMEDELTRLRGEEIACSAIAVGTARVLHLLPPTILIDLQELGLPGDGKENINTDGEEDNKAAPPILWERIARHQKEETQKAVMDNIKLRAMLEGQLSIARSLETALRKKPRFASTELNPYLGTGSTIHLDGVDEQKIYESIGLELDVQYAQVDAILASSGLEGVTKECIFGAQVRADASGMFLEHKETRCVPFDVHAVGKAVWETLGRDSMPLIQNQGVYIARETTDDTVCAKVVDTFKLPMAKTETVVTIRLVLKRYLEENRVVSVWESMVETVGPVCLRMREKAWNILRPHFVVDPQTGQETEMCLAQSIIRVWPEMATSDTGDGMEVGTLTNLVVGSYQRNMGMMAQIVHQLLTDQEAKK